MLMFYLAAIEEDSDKALFERIYLKISDDIFRRVYGILKNMDDTEDAVQDTWYKVCTHMDVLRGKDERVIRAYIMSIAKNQALSVLRTRKREAGYISDVEPETVSDGKDLFDICQKLDENDILECMKELGQTYCDVLAYYYLHGHTLKEIARIMGMKESTVGSRLTRGKEKLVSLLERRGMHE